MADANLRIKIGSKADKSGFLDAKANLASLQSTGLATSKAIATAFAAAGAAMTAVWVVSAKKAAEFEQAVTEATAIAGGGFDELRKKALETGAATKFTAAESATALKNFAQAGFGVQRSIDALSGAVDFASATGHDLAATTEMMAATVSQFGLAATDTTHIADVFTKAQQNSLLNNEKLTVAMRYAGVIAKQFGYSLEETTAYLAAISNAGLEASQIGTGLRQTFAQLATVSKAGEDALAKYGLTVEDINPETHKLIDTLKLFAERNIGVKDTIDILGVKAAGAFGAMVEQVKQGTIDIDKFTAMLQDSQGTAAKTAAEMLNTVEGQWTITMSAFDGVLIQLGSATELLRKNMITGMGEIFNIIKDLLIKNDGNIKRVALSSAKAFTMMGSVMVDSINTVGSEMSQFLVWFGGKFFKKVLEVYRGLQVLQWKHAQAGASISKFLGSSDAKEREDFAESLKLEINVTNQQIKAVDKMTEAFVTGAEKAKDAIHDSLIDSFFALNDKLHMTEVEWSSVTKKITDDTTNQTDEQKKQLADLMAKYKALGAERAKALGKGSRELMGPPAELAGPGPITETGPSSSSVVGAFSSGSGMQVLGQTSAMFGGGEEAQLGMAVLSVMKSIVETGATEFIDGIVLEIPNIIIGFIDAVPELIEAIVMALPKFVFAVVEALAKSIALVLRSPGLIVEIGMALVKAVPMMAVALAEEIAKAFAPIVEFFRQINPFRGSEYSKQKGGLTTFQKAKNWFSETFHDGGMVGRARIVPAPRLHSGAFIGSLARDEVPAILQTGERVLSRQEVMAGAGGVTTMHVTINAVDSRSFEDMLQRNSGSFADAIYRAVSRGDRGRLGR